MFKRKKDYKRDLLFWIYEQHSEDFIDIKPWIKKSGIPINNYNGNGNEMPPDRPLLLLLDSISMHISTDKLLTYNGNWHLNYYMGTTATQIPYSQAVFKFKLTKNGLDYVMEQKKYIKTRQAFIISIAAFGVSVISAATSIWNIVQSQKLPQIQVEQTKQKAELNSLNDTVKAFQYQTNHHIQLLNTKIGETTAPAAPETTHQKKK